jgi:hypothetical protein
VEILNKKNLHISFAYSLAVFTGFYLTNQFDQGDGFQIFFSMASGSGLWIYALVTMATPHPSFWAMSIPMLFGLIVVSYLICMIVEKFNSKSKLTEGRYIFRKIMTIFWVNWALQAAGTALIHYPKK